MKNLLAAVLLTMLPTYAIAAECTADSDCPVGFACEEVTTTCATTCTPCACACQDGDAGCEPCECPPCDAACEPVVTNECVFSPKACAADADCGDGFACLAVEVCSGGGSACACTTCACPACADGMDCPPCDCPDVQECTCPEPEPPTCEVEGSYCQVKQIECTADADCPEGFNCVAGMDDCACAGCACPSCADGMDCMPCECPPCDCGDPTSYCLPAGWEDLGFSSPSDGEVQKGGGESTTSGGDATTADSGATSNPPVASGDQDASNTGAAASADNTSAAPGASDGSSGCMVGAGAPAATLALFLVPFFGLVRRRRL